MPKTLQLPKSFDHLAVPTWLGTWRSNREEGKLALELPPDAFVHPAGAALLSAGIAWRQARTLRTWLRQSGGAGNALMYLQRMDFFEELGVHSSEGFARHDPSGRFVPLKRITDRTVARQLANQVGDFLEQQLPDVAPSPLRMARFILEELGNNIVQHSGAPHTGFGLAQAYPNLRRVEIAFADAGVGFLESLQRNPELAGRIESDADALQIAFERGLSGVGASRTNMGVGLAMLQSFADLVGGDLWVASGEALLHRRTVGKVRSNSLRAIPRWDGSWICLQASLG